MSFRERGQMDILGSCPSYKGPRTLVKPGPLGATSVTRASAELTPEAWPGTRRSTDCGISINGVGTRRPTWAVYQLLIILPQSVVL